MGQGQVILQNCSGGGNGTPIIFTNIIENSAPFDVTTEDLKGVNEVADYAFYHSQIKSIEIGINITRVGVYAFGYCTNLTDIYYQGSQSEWKVLKKGAGWDYNTGEYIIHCVDGDITKAAAQDLIAVTYSYNEDQGGYGIKVSEDPNDGTRLIIPAEYQDTPVTFIIVDGFKNCTNLQSVIVADSVKLFASFVFLGCSNLDSIIIPEGLERLGSSVFMNCTSLRSITLPSTVTAVNGYTFKGCSSLETLTLNSKFNIPNEFIYNCINLKSIIFNGTRSEWNQLSKGTDWDYSAGNYIVHCTDGDISKS